MKAIQSLGQGIRTTGFVAGKVAVLVGGGLLILGAASALKDRFIGRDDEMDQYDAVDDAELDELTAQDQN